MLKKLFFFTLVICIFCSLFSCGYQTPNVSQTQTEVLAPAPIPASSEETPDSLPPETKVPESQETPDTALPPESQETPDTALPPDTSLSIHTHQWGLVSESKASCSLNGKRIWKCSCGEQKNEMIPKAHVLTPATCTVPATCTLCGATQGKALEHTVSGDRCTRCGERVDAPIFVLGKGFSFDEKTEDILSKLGEPTERIREGDLVSLVYAADLSRLTVIQTDADGLWGVFTFDRASRILIDNENMTIATFSGKRDENSDACFRDVGSCRIYGFRDGLGDGKNYAMWFRYYECRYDYINDSRLYSDFSGQSRLSFYYVNALRYRHGLSPLIWSDKAAKIATDYSAYMIEKDFFGHDHKYGERLTAAGVSWRWSGENISQGYFNALFVCDAYYHSQGHRENILSSNFTHVGIGFSRRANDSPLVLGGQIFYS